MSQPQLLRELQEAVEANLANSNECQACRAVTAAEPGAVQDALRAALAGTIGRDKLVVILQRNGINVGRRHLVKHRQEGHKP